MVVMYLISVPIWVAAFMCVLMGLAGTFDAKIRGKNALIALAMLPVGSGLFYLACRLCGFV